METLQFIIMAAIMCAIIGTITGLGTWLIIRHYLKKYEEKEELLELEPDTTGPTIINAINELRHTGEPVHIFEKYLEIIKDMQRVNTRLVDNNNILAEDNERLKKTMESIIYGGISLKL